MDRRRALAWGAAVAWPSSAARATAPAAAPAAALADVGGAGDGQRVLRLAIGGLEGSLDPTQITGSARDVTAHIFESLYTYDHLARPPRMVPLVADGPPQHNDDFTLWTFTLRRGICFAADPAFGGRRRELVASDFVFAISRFADPALRARVWGFLDGWQILGLAEARKEALLRKGALDYRRPIEGLRALDTHRLQIRLGKPNPRFAAEMAASDLMGAVAPEVVQAYGDAIGEHPVGTGPFRLRQWRRSSLLVLERNPGYRERRWDAEPAADDAEGQAIAARLRGRQLPLVDRVELAIVSEEQPRWASFVTGAQDLILGVPSAYLPVAMPGGRVAPYLARRGVRGMLALQSNMSLTMFNMEDPVVGGYDAPRVALRRAIGLALDVPREIELTRQGLAVVAQSPLVPGTSGYEPSFRSEMGEHSPARARALLDLYGYVDRNGDGWREGLDGRPLTLTVACGTSHDDRLRNDLWRRSLHGVGIRVEFKSQARAENQKAARAGRLQIWEFVSGAASADGHPMLSGYYGGQVGGWNPSRFRLPAMDAVYERLGVLPDGPERDALFLQAKRLAVAYMPYKVRWHGVSADLVHAHVIGFRRPAFWQEWWHMVDVPPAQR